MKTILKVLFFSLFSLTAFAQLEVAKSDTAAASKASRIRIEANTAGRVGQKGSTGNFSPFALVSEVTAATGGAVTSVNTKTGPTVSLVSTDIPEGANLYWTTARGDARYPLLSGSYANPTWISSLAYSKLTGTPTTVSAAGLTDAVSTGGSYTNPTWLVSLPYSKLTSTPTTITGYGITDAVSTSGTYANPSWLTSLAFSKLTSTPTTIGGYGITDADPYQTVATYAAMNALTFSANTAKRVLVTADETYSKTNQWYMVWADGSAVMHADKIVTISEK